MKEKNLPKLKNEILKLFGSSLSIDSNIPIGKNEIKLPEVETVQAKEESSVSFDKPENVNITIQLPQEAKQRDYSKTVKSFKNGKVYNIDVKKNETPLRYFLDNNQQIENNRVELVKPVNFINYNLTNNRNIETVSPSFNEEYVIDRTKVENIQNAKNEYLKEYIKILNNYTSSVPNKNTTNIDNSQNIKNVLYTKPYTFLTNSQQIVLENIQPPDIQNNVTNVSSPNIQSTAQNNVQFFEKPNYVQITSGSTETQNNVTNISSPNIQSTAQNNVQFFEKPNYVQITGGSTETQNNVTVKNIIQNRIFSNVQNERVSEIIPAFAEGGIVKKPTISLIGEKEPEVIIPKSKLAKMFNPSMDQNKAIQKQEMKMNIDSFIKTGDISTIPTLEQIKNNENGRESLEQEEIFMKMTDAPPKVNKTQIQTVISDASFDQSQQGVVKTGATKGIAQFVPETQSLPSWRGRSF